MRKIQIRRILAICLCLTICLSITPVVWAEEFLDDFSENDHDYLENGDVLYSEEVLDQGGAEPVWVYFMPDPSDAQITVYDPRQLDEYGYPVVFQPEPDGTYYLLPGEYLVNVEREGYLPYLAVPLTVESMPLELPVVMTPVENRVAVVFTSDVPDLSVFVFEIIGENSETLFVEPEADGRYLLLPGRNYSYDAEAVGYVSLVDQSFEVTELDDPQGVLEIPVVLAPILAEFSEEPVDGLSQAMDSDDDLPADHDTVNETADLTYRETSDVIDSETGDTTDARTTDMTDGEIVGTTNDKTFDTIDGETADTTDTGTTDITDGETADTSGSGTTDMTDGETVDMTDSETFDAIDGETADTTAGGTTDVTDGEIGETTDGASDLSGIVSIDDAHGEKVDELESVGEVENTEISVNIIVESINDSSPEKIEELINESSAPIYTTIEESTTENVVLSENIPLLTSVNDAPVITAHPESITVNEGSDTVFCVEASGSNLSYQWQYSSDGGSSCTVTASGAGLSYQWQYSSDGGSSWWNSPAEGNQTATLIIQAVDWRNGFQYRCVVTNSEGSSWWNSPAEGNQTATLIIQAVDWRNGFQYRCVVTNSEGTVYSDAATLTIEIQIGNIIYRMKDSNSLFVYKYLGMSASSLTISETVNGRTVVEIGPSAFENHTELTSVDLPDSITVIGKRAFAGCTSLSTMS